jgi:rhamnose transport system ATP-binding protein
MVGRDLLETDSSFSRGARSARPAILEVKNLSRTGVFQNISFDLHEGEILGLSGLVGAGRSEVAHTIFGIDRADSGEVIVNGLPLSGSSVQEAMHAGLALVPEDRQHLGLVLPMSVGANLSLAKLPEISTFGVISSKKERALIQQLMQTLAVKAASPNVPAQTLSGGNQQKLVLGKWLGANPKILILDEPTRGVDVGAKAEVHRLIHKLADEGMATLLISSDLPEILAMSDRIIVMRSGRLAGELARRDATQEKVLSLAIPAGAAA